MDKTEYTRIVEKYYDDIKRVAFAGCKNIHDAEDIAQTTFVKLMKYTGEFEDDDHLKKWLIRVAVNEYKSLWSSPWKSKVDYFIPERASGGSSGSPKNNAVLGAVMGLKQKYREVIHLFYYEEYSAKEISEMLKISENTVFKRLQRARDKLREKLENTYYRQTSKGSEESLHITKKENQKWMIT